MKFSYRTASLLLFLGFLAPVIFFGILVQYRIEQRQNLLQAFLKNQIDIDRQMLDARQYIVETQTIMRTIVINRAAGNKEIASLQDITERAAKFSQFWNRYEVNYSAQNRPLLQDVLEETQETGLIEEEAEKVRAIRKTSDTYFSAVKAYISSYDSISHDARRDLEFFSAADEMRLAVFKELNDITDIRFIFSQRIIFAMSGENDRQYGFFTSIFVVIFAALFILSVLEYFFIHKPFKDIMFFLRDMRDGKRGQRLYFTSPVKEIKESEDIINEFVDKAERYENKR